MDHLQRRSHGWSRPSRSAGPHRPGSVSSRSVLGGFTALYFREFPMCEAVTGTYSANQEVSRFLG